MINSIFCLDATANFLGLFDLTIAPTLLFYSYLPVVVVSILFGYYIYKRSSEKLVGRLLLINSMLFAVWVFSAIIEWTAIHATVVHFFWEIIGIIEISIYLLSIYFMHVFITGKDLGFKSKILLFIASIPVLATLPTYLNMSSFDLVNCQSNNGPIWYYIYAFEVFAIVLIAWMCIKRISDKTLGKDFRKQIFYLMFGTVLFLSIFTITNIFGDATLLYEINLIGPLGMVAFLAFLSFMIVKFKTFNIKLLGTQAFVWAVVILIGSQSFFIQTNVNRILNAITLVLTSVLGLLIVRGVKKEIALREELSIANENQQLLIRFITHQVKGFFTKSKAIFAGLLDGDFGSIDDTAKNIVKEGLDSDNKAVNMVQEVLNASSLRAGTTQFTLERVDFGKLITNIADDFIKIAKEKGLEYEIKVKEGLFAMVDTMQISQVIKNLIDNSVKYTQSGKVTVGLEERKLGRNLRLLFYVKDTGVGISESDKKVLFTEGGRGEESLRLNVNSTGYGLFIVKKIVDGHQGHIWAESAGRGKGATFFVEIEEVK